MSLSLIHIYFIFNGNNQIAVFLYMLLVNLQEILKGCLGRNVALPVFKNTDKKDIIIITGQHRFNTVSYTHLVVALPAWYTLAVGS